MAALMYRGDRLWEITNGHGPSAASPLAPSHLIPIALIASREAESALGLEHGTLLSRCLLPCDRGNESVEVSVDLTL
jgi:hypothetical protein